MFSVVGQERQLMSQRGRCNHNRRSKSPLICLLVCVKDQRSWPDRLQISSSRPRTTAPERSSSSIARLRFRSRPRLPDRSGPPNARVKMQNKRSARLQCELYLAYCGRTLAVRRVVLRLDGHAVRITSGGCPTGLLVGTVLRLLAGVGREHGAEGKRD